MATHKPNTKRLTERCANPLAGARVDRDAGVIRNVLICGFESANGRDYPANVLKRDFAKYEGRPVNFDHARDSTVSRRGGWLENVRPGPDGKPRGDLHLLKSHPNYGPVMEAAERNPALFGMSHVAMCRTSTKGGREVVEAIDRVESIDIVADPATTNGFFEHRNRGAAVPTTLRAVIEQAKPKLKDARLKEARKLLLLAEDDAAMGAMMDAPVDGPAEGTDPDQAIDDAFKQAMHAQVDALLEDSHSLAEFLTKIRELYKSRQKIMGNAEPKDGGSDADPTTPEGRTRVDYPGLMKECRLAGYAAPTDLDLVALGSMTEEQRAEYIGERVKATKGAETPQSAGRGAGAAPTKESKQAPAAPAAFSWQD